MHQEKNDHNAIRDSYRSSDYKIQIALYVSLRSATNQEMRVLDHAQQEARESCARPPPPNCTWNHVDSLSHGKQRILLVFAYRRIAKHVIHLRQAYPASFESSPRCDEVDSQPPRARAVIYWRTLRREGGAHAHASVAVAIVSARSRQSTRRGLSPTDSSLITFFFLATSTREKLAWRQCPARAFDHKGHPSSRAVLRARARSRP